MGKAKQVDMALTVRAIAEAAKGNYDIALLIAGDEDYVPLVNGIKELGKSVYLSFFDEPRGGLSPELRRASDAFFPLGDYFRSRWEPKSTTAGVAQPEYLSTGTIKLTSG